MPVALVTVSRNASELLAAAGLTGYSMSWSTGRTPPIRTRLASLTLQCSWRPRAGSGPSRPARRWSRTPPPAYGRPAAAVSVWSWGSARLGSGRHWKPLARTWSRCLSTRPRHTAHRSVAAGVRGIRPRPQGHREALTALGNGYLGTRGAAPEHAADQPQSPLSETPGSEH